ncbi:hypothetical protein [Tsukamurella sp. 1534]|uniref:hypothetical protein n=1 Tax=Tsukamurella sp. 1534 TaxID=1151061 RepID=UPI0002F897F0|nr:hypothetical protein [Tsukamurella sp. 1534]
MTSALRRPKDGDTDADRARALVFLVEISPSAGHEHDVPALVERLRSLPVDREGLERAVATAADPGAVWALLEPGA